MHLVDRDRLAAASTLAQCSRCASSSQTWSISPVVIEAVFGRSSRAAGEGIGLQRQELAVLADDLEFVDRAGLDVRAAKISQMPVSGAAA